MTENYNDMDILAWVAQNMASKHNCMLVTCEREPYSLDQVDQTVILDLTELNTLSVRLRDVILECLDVQEKIKVHEIYMNIHQGGTLKIGASGCIRTVHIRAMNMR